MLKILYVSDLPGVHDYKNLSEILRNGHRVLYYCNSKIIEYPSFKRIGYYIPSISGLDIYNNPKLSSTSGLFLYQRTKELKKIYKDFNPDVVHTGWIQTAGWLAYLAKTKPYLIQPYGSDVFLVPESSLVNRFKTIFAVKNASKVVTNSRTEKDILSKLIPDKSGDIVFIPRGVDLSIFKGKVSESEKEKIKSLLGLKGKIILVSNKNFRPIYGLKYLLIAMERILKKFPEIELVLIGGGPEESNLKKLAQKLNIVRNIIWAGYRTSDEIYSYLQASDIYISSSLSDGSSVSLLEAMASGLPVAITDIPGHREWIEDKKGGLFFQKKDPPSIVETITRLLKVNRSELESMGSINVKVVQERGDFRKNFSLILSLLEEISID